MVEAQTGGVLPTGRTALWWAAEKNNFEIAEMLVKAGANPNICTEDGISALHLACAGKKIPMAECLVSHGADISLRNKVNYRS